MPALLNTLLRDVGLLQNLYKRIPMMFNIVNIPKVPWVPPLFMLINPSTLERSSSKLITTQKTRNAWIEYHWGDALDTLTASGSTGGFYLPYAGLASGSKKPFSRTTTISHYNFINLLNLYRSNGAIYDDFGAIVGYGSIRLFYDLTNYLGYFTEFSFKDSETHPYRFDIDFTFKVQATVQTLSPGSII